MDTPTRTEASTATLAAYDAATSAGERKRNGKPLAIDWCIRSLLKTVGVCGGPGPTPASGQHPPPGPPGTGERELTGGGIKLEAGEG